MPVVKSYRYLGLELSGSDNTFKECSRQLAGKGSTRLGAMYRQIADLGVEMDHELSLRLFNALVLPGMTYGSEIWGPELMEMSMFEDPISKVLHGFYKKLLNVRSAVPSMMVYRELGIYPLQMVCMRQMVRFHNKLIKMPTTCLARKALIAGFASKDVAEHSNSWVSKFEKQLSLLGCTVPLDSSGVPQEI